MSYKEIAEKTGIQKSYLSFLFNNFNYNDKTTETEWEWWEIAILIFAGIGVIDTILTILKWI